MDTTFFNAHHSPIGAFATLTLGCKGARGGLGLELGKPADESLYIGIEAADAPARTRYEALPFFEAAEQDEAARYEVAQAEGGESQEGARIVPFADEDIDRDFRLATDTWTAGDMELSIYSPVRGVPDPDEASGDELAEVLLPAVFAELTVDNTGCDRDRRTFFGYAGSDPYTAMHRLDALDAAGMTGIGQGTHCAVATDADGAEACQHFSMEHILDPANELNRYFALGGTGCVLVTVGAGEKKTFRFVVAFYRDGCVTPNVETLYFYRRYFDTIEEVVEYGLSNFDAYVAAAGSADAEIRGADHLSDDQKFMLAHAVRSYYGSTQLLDADGDPFWIVGEGEYRMMNTFDLTVDQLFFEMRLNPWTVRNELNWFLRRYSYRDKVRLPGDETEYPGGISFTHDMGMANALTRPEYSSYEQFGLDGCFSHMTHEQLVNFVLCAATYIAGTGDEAWRVEVMETLEECLESMVNRDHPDPNERDGIMSCDSSRTRGGAEITTFDSLDASLGQARNNLYMAVKCWAAYVALDRLLRDAGRIDAADQAARQAKSCARSIEEKVDTDDTLPAVFEADNTSRIIPAIEGLVFPLATGCDKALDPEGEFGFFVKLLKTHLVNVLKPGVCLFGDGGWKLSSTSDNSWLSKIYLSQFVAREILDLPWDEKGRAADAAHVAWLLDPDNVYWAWSDQMVAGKAMASKYYPRGVTSILWLDE